MMHRLATLARFEVCRSDAESGSQGIAIFQKHHAAVVSSIGPLVCIRRPRIGVLETTRHVRVLRGNARPEAECAIHVDPSALFLGRRADFLRGIKGAGVYVACLNAHYGSIRQVRPAVIALSSLPVRFRLPNALPSETRYTQGFQKRCVNFLAEHNLN